MVPNEDIIKMLKQEDGDDFQKSRKGKKRKNENDEKHYAPSLEAVESIIEKIQNETDKVFMDRNNEDKEASSSSVVTEVVEVEDPDVQFYNVVEGCESMKKFHICLSYKALEDIPH
eukprot:10336157-Ditylum_brightwellii.AAC.1